MSEIPAGWTNGCVADLGVDGEQAVLTGPFGSNLSSSDFTVSGVPVLTIGCLTDHGIRLDKAMHVSSEKAIDLNRYRLAVGDMLFSRMASVGRAGFVDARLSGALFNYHIMRLRLDPKVYLPSLFLAYVRGAPEVRRYLDDVNHGATRDGINTEQLLGLPVLVPPLNEQRRIVDKLDAVFEKSRAAKARLERLPALLEKLKRSILAAAFRGDLTKDWRAANPNVEPASVLLERIRAERRRRWEDGLRAKGKDPKKATYEEPAAVDVEGLPELPEGWAWASLEQIAAIQGGIQKQPSRAPTTNRFPFLRVANVLRGRLDLREVHEIELFAGEPERLRLEPDDLLIVEGNGSPSEIGRTARWDGSVQNCVHQNHLIRARAERGVSPNFVEHFWNSPFGAAQVLEVAHTTTGLFTLSVRKIAPLAVPVPPTEEQATLVKVLGDLFGSLSEMIGRVDSAAIRTTNLEQAALAKAFRGDLVPQDPTDEPAAVLLDRIRAARADTVPRRGRRTSPPAPLPEGRGEPDKTRADRSAPLSLQGEGSARSAGGVVLRAFHQAPRLSAAALVDVTGLDAASVKKALKALVDSEQVRVEGKARGTTYVWQGT
jgi:type I restriction enzyme S subunit